MDDNSEYREVLSVILDLNLYWWSCSRIEHNFEMSYFVNSVITFVRMYVNLTPKNYLAIIGVTNDRSEYLYTTDSLNVVDRKQPKIPKLGDTQHIISDSLNRNNFLMEQEIRENIYKLIHPKDNILLMSSNLSGGLIKSLCFYKRKQADFMEKYKTKQVIGGRFLIIRTPAEENSATFTTMMNAIFGIQKLKICIDVVLLKNNMKEIQSKSVSNDSSHSTSNNNQSNQTNNNNAPGVNSGNGVSNDNNNNDGNNNNNKNQIVKYAFSPVNHAAYLTGGTFCEVGLQTELVQYLITLYLPCQKLRKKTLLTYHKQSLEERINESWDYNGICLCHGNRIQVGFVCSLCLGVFCQYSVYCLRCKTSLAFDKPTTNSLKNVLKSTDNAKK